MSNPDTIAKIRAELAQAQRYYERDGDVTPMQMACVLTALRMLVDEIDPLSRVRRESVESKRR